MSMCSVFFEKRGISWGTAQALMSVPYVTAGLEREVADLGGRVAAAKEAYKAAAAQLERRRARLRECDREISGVVRDRDDLAKQLTDAQVERKRLEHKCVSPNPPPHLLGSECVCEGVSRLPSHEKRGLPFLSDECIYTLHAAWRSPHMRLRCAG